MHRFLLSLIVLVGLNGLHAQEINWMTINEALEAQKEDPKKIFMDAYANWCGPCKLLDRETFTHKDVVNYINEHYYPVKFNAEGDETVRYADREFKNPNYDPSRAQSRNSQHQFAQALGINSYPTMIFFDEEGGLLGPVLGFQKPRDLEVFLKFFSEDTYKEITDAEDFLKYQWKFKHSFAK